MPDTITADAHAENEIIRKEKYIYYVLAVIGACIAFTVNQAQSELWNAYLLIPLLSILMWSVSFFLGLILLKKIEKMSRLKYEGVNLVEEYDRSPSSDEKVDKFNADLKIIQDKYDLNKRKIKSFESFFLSLLVLGVLFYLIWSGFRIYNHHNLTPTETSPMYVRIIILHTLIAQP
ncbi:MAG: hypothetical protein ACHQF4_06685 [Sphingobacteriales bacterium]